MPSLINGPFGSVNSDPLESAALSWRTPISIIADGHRRSRGWVDFCPSLERGRTARLRRSPARDHDAAASPMTRTTREATRAKGGSDAAACPGLGSGLCYGESDRCRSVGTGSAEYKALRLYVRVLGRLPKGRAADWRPGKYRLGAGQLLCHLHSQG